MRKHDSLEKNIIMGTLPGKQARGRPNRSWMNNITAWTGMTINVILTKTEGRSEWKAVIWCVVNPRIDEDWKNKKKTVRRRKHKWLGLVLCHKVLLKTYNRKKNEWQSDKRQKKTGHGQWLQDNNRISGGQVSWVCGVQRDEGSQKTCSFTTEEESTTQSPPHHCPSVLDTVGWVIWSVTIVPDMTYNVFGGMKMPTAMHLGL